MFRAASSRCVGGLPSSGVFVLVLEAHFFRLGNETRIPFLLALLVFVPISKRSRRRRVEQLHSMYTCFHY